MMIAINYSIWLMFNQIYLTHGLSDRLYYLLIYLTRMNSVCFCINTMWLWIWIIL